jgi:leucyl-tRNA synthetase
MFLGPLEAMKPWNTKGIEGIARFLRKAWRLFINEDGSLRTVTDSSEIDPETERTLHATIKKVSEDYEALGFNTAISQMMICVNALAKVDALPQAIAESFLKLLAPLAPHIAEELWERLGYSSSIVSAGWPEYDPAKLVQNTVKIVFQVNGKYRGDTELPADVDAATAIAAAKSEPKVAAFLEGKTLHREIYVPGKIVNLVAK